MVVCYLFVYLFRENGGHWIACYKCESIEIAINSTKKPHFESDQATKIPKLETDQLKDALEFGQELLTEILKPPWTSNIENINEALAYIQVSETIAGKLLALLPPGEKAVLKIENVSTIYMETIPSATGKRFVSLAL